MAQKRMFDKYVIDSDNFLDMPLTTQAVYFHLNMRADDDGFVDNWKSILRIIGGKEDDIKILISKSFILPFETGIIVIKHWKINNYLQKDRKKATRHVEELKTLKESNGEYFLLEQGEESNVLITETRQIPEWQKRRDEVYKNSSLPYSFNYKIKMAFYDKPCPICGNIMQNSHLKKFNPSIQHIRPISKGGQHELDNIAVICGACNSTLSNKEIEGKLNNEEVIKIWNKISEDKDYFSRLTNGNVDKNRIEENSIVEGSIDNIVYTSTIDNGNTIDIIENSLKSLEVKE